MLQNIGYFGILLGVLVFVHELGHFLVAKALGVKVLRFSIGFGPRIVGFTWGETEYRIAWVPLGGYVKMAGELPYEELAPEEAGRGFLAQAPWRRGLIVAAGPVFNLVFPVLVLFIAFMLPHESYSTRVGGVEPGLPAAEANLQPGDRILAVDGQKVETFEELREELRPRYEKQITLTVERAGKQFQAQLTPAKAVENNPVEKVPQGLIGISSVALPPMLGVPPGSVAEKAGLKTFDRILSINGKPVRDEVALAALLPELSGALELKVARSAKVPLPGVEAQDYAIVTATLEKQPGTGYAALGAERSDLYVGSVIPGSPAEKAGIKPGDRVLALNDRPLRSITLYGLALQEWEAKPFTLAWRSAAGEEQKREVQQAATESTDSLGQSTASFDLGLRFKSITAADELSSDKVTLRRTPGQALARALRVVPETIAATSLALGRLLIGKVPFKSVGGPIMLYQVASKSAEQGPEFFLGVMAAISVNLGLVNLLPIPILDGFHLLAAFWEGIRRRPIPMRAREIANLVGLAMLLVLMVLVFKNDLTR